MEQGFPWNIRVPRHGEGPRMIEIYREAFGRRSPRRVLPSPLRRGRSLVAAAGGEIGGILCVDRADDSLDGLLACLDPLARRLIEPIAGALPEEETLAVEILAPPGLSLRRSEGALVVAAIAVDRRYRRRGVGRALAEVGTGGPARARQIFAHCVAGSGSRELFEGLGFVPLVRVARYYGDGTGMTLVYRPSRGG